MSHRTSRLSRREFAGRIAAGGAALLASPLSGLSRAETSGGPACDVLVFGATPGGIAAAVAAARLGRTVILAEYEDHIGGIVSNGLTNADIDKKQAVGGLFYEFTRRVVKHYAAVDQGVPGAPNVKACTNGYHYEAGVAERLLHEMIDGEGPRIRLLLRHALNEAVVKGGRLDAVVLEDLAQAGRLAEFRAKVFVDATYEGDLAAMAGAPFRTGREARAEFNEPHAGRIYMRFGTAEPLPGSTGEGDHATEAYCFRFHATNIAANRVPIEKPRGYKREDYACILENIRSGRATAFRHIIQLIPVPGGKFELNSDHPHPDTGVPSESLDLAEECWDWPTAGMARRREIYERYLAHNVGLIWLLQNDPEVPAALREDALQWGWCRDEWPGNGHVPRQVYVRQGRRIEGDCMLTERDADPDPELGRTRVRPDSIGVIEWAFDPHGCHKYDPAHPGVREGYCFVKHLPFQVPYGVIVPRTVDGLLVPVACSCSHVAYNALRMEPVFMALGEASGVAAHLAIGGGVPVRRVPAGALQRLLVERGGVITFYEDLKFDDPAFAAFQWLGARGLNTGYRAGPDLKLTRGEGAARLSRILQFEGKAWKAPREDPESALHGEELARWLRDAGFTPEGAGFGAGEEINVRQFAMAVYRVLSGGGKQ